MEDCLFCSIVSGSVPSYCVFEDEWTKAFLDIYPSAPGHTMVILKKHGWALSDYMEEELIPLWNTVRRISIALEQAYHLDVQTIGINHREPNGVHHLHIHLIPRTPDDEGGVIQSIVKRQLSDDLVHAKRLITAALSNPERSG